MNKSDKAIRLVTAAVVVALGAVAAYVSYTHALEVAQGHGEAGASGRLLPLTIDGLVFVASMVMLDSARRGGRTPRLAAWALGAGIGATVAVNVVHGLAHGPVGAAISAWPAVTLVLAVELLMGMVRRGRTPASSATNVAPSGVAEVAEDARAEVYEGAAWWPPFVHLTPPSLAPAAGAAGAAEVADARSDLAAAYEAEEADLNHVDQGVVDVADAGQGLVVDLPSAVRSARTAGRTERQIAREFGVSRYRVRRILDASEDAPGSAINGHTVAGAAELAAAMAGRNGAGADPEAS